MGRDMNRKFDVDPGLTVRVLVADAEPLEGGDITKGTMVVVTVGMFKGLVGHIHEIEPEANFVIRQGHADAWIGR